MTVLHSAPATALVFVENSVSAIDYDSSSFGIQQFLHAGQYAFFRNILMLLISHQ